MADTILALSARKDFDSFQSCLNEHPELMDTWVTLEHFTSPLHEAIHAGQIQNVQLLLERGTKLIDESDGRKQAPIDLAISHPDIVRLLLEHGCNSNPIRVGNIATPLHHAAMNGYIETVEHLIRIGKCDVDVHDNYGITPMHYAAMGCQLPTIERLLQFGSQSVNTIGKGDKGNLLLILASGLKYSVFDRVGLAGMVENPAPQTEAFIRLVREYGQPVDLDAKCLLSLTILDLMISYTYSDGVEIVDDRLEDTVRLLMALNAPSKFKTEITIDEQFQREVKSRVYFETSLTSLLLKQLLIAETKQS